MPTSGSDMMRRRERANAFCESIRALDATDLPASNVRDFLLPAIQNLLKDPDSLDPAHKEALEIITRERSGGTLEAFSKVMGAHLGIASSVSSFFGEAPLLGKKESGDPPGPVESPKAMPQTPVEDTSCGPVLQDVHGPVARQGFLMWGNLRIGVSDFDSSHPVVGVGFTGSLASSHPKLGDHSQKYYGGDLGKMLDILLGCKRTGCTFLVGGRNSDVVEIAMVLLRFLKILTFQWS
ncbi:hypothetical protein NE237_020884 [Protea cynaroides]|uniref:Uncharacterized protein n=1 Tax=Protea cynaroides TaxID=273540 RepID=A0A9Q0H843_9MAGN|nr:hypothetical protein NE237_020884 [Protea cynaroides]